MTPFFLLDTQLDSTFEVQLRYRIVDVKSAKMLFKRNPFV